MDVLPATESMYQVCALRGRRGVRSPGTGVTDDCKLSAMWVLELNLVPLPQHRMFLTIEPSLLLLVSYS